MSQQRKLEQVLELLINEDSDQAAELLHQIIVEKARMVYESVIDEEDEDEVMEADEVGGDMNDDFTKEIAVDKDEIGADELMDGEPEDSDEDDEDEFQDDQISDEEGQISDDEERITDLEDQLAELRAEFDALMGEELDEPNHGELPDEFAEIEDEYSDNDFGHDTQDEMVMNSMYESKKSKDAKAKAMKEKEMEKSKKTTKKKVDEETQFTKKVADTNQRSKNPGYIGTGKDTPRGAEQDKSTFTKVPSKPSYGGEPVDFGKGHGDPYGEYHGDHAEDSTLSDNMDFGKGKSVPATDKGDKWAGTGKETGNFGTQGKKSPLSKAPPKPM